MEFSNLFFLTLFLPLCIAVYYLAPSIKFKNGILLGFSFLFCAMGSLLTLPMLLCSIAMHYVLSCRCKNRRLSLVLTLAWDILCLLGCKLLCPDAMPIGISFYTFSLISYQADLCCGKVEACPSFGSLALYAAMFPKLFMGPIVRYEQVEKQLSDREHSFESAFAGSVRFVCGLSKKLLLADRLYLVYEQLCVQASGLSAWLAGLCFMLYIYFEFSGYADMAIGLGKIFGFSFCENFDRPYCASSVSEFWRRWHISLGSFFRDYVYIPLGGNRKGTGRQIFNLLVVWLLTGAWHGLQPNFLMWGLYFFVLICVEKLFAKWIDRVPYVLRLMVTQLFILLGWILFAASDLSSLGVTLQKLFAADFFFHESTWLTLQSALPLLLICLIGCSPLVGLLSSWFKRKTAQNARWFYAAGVFLLCAALLLLCLASLVAGAGKPSMYASF